MALPLFFPQVKFVPSVDRAEAITLEALCAQAGVSCKAFGRWTQRPVIVREAGDALPWIHAEPGDWNAVEIGVPSLKSNQARARWALGALAFSALFDGVARASVAGQPWARIEYPRGLPPSSRRPMTGAERIRRKRAQSKVAL